MNANITNWSSPDYQEFHKIIKDEIAPIVNQVDARVQNFKNHFVKEAAKFVQDFKSLANEADESHDKISILEKEIERLLRAVVSQDIMSIVQRPTVIETSNLQTELERTKEKFENFVRQSNAFQSDRPKFSKTRVPPKVVESNDLSNLVTSNSAPTTKESKVVKNDKVIAPGMFRYDPSNIFLGKKYVNSNSTVSQPDDESSDDTPSVSWKFLNEVKDTIVTLQSVIKHRMNENITNWSSPAYQEFHKIIKDEIATIVNQVDARVQNFKNHFVKEAAKFVRDFKSLANEADESLDKISILEKEIERLLRAVVSQDIMSIVQRPTVIETSDLQTELAPYNNMHHQIERLQAQLGDIKGKSMDTQCASDTLDPSSQKLEDENMSLEFQVLNYAKKFPPKVVESNDLSNPVTSNSAPTTKESKVVKNDKVIAPGMFRIDPSNIFLGKKYVNSNSTVSQLDDESSDDSPSVAWKFLNEVKDTIVTLQSVIKHRMNENITNWSSPVYQEFHKIIKDEIAPIVNQVDARVQNFKNHFVKEAAKFVRDFKSLTNKADESLDKILILEKEIEYLLRAVVSQDIMSIVQRPTIIETFDLQTELERTKEKFENYIIKKETKYAKHRNDWYKKCEECKYDKISYDEAYNNMHHQIERLQAQLGDIKGKSMDNQCASDTLDPLSQKLEDENMSLEFQVLNYANKCTP
ncbi:hypothetical protein Tco_0322110 [Tanacetum coccineum]